MERLDWIQPKAKYFVSLSSDAPMCYLEVEDAGVVAAKALVGGNDSGHHIFVLGQGGDGRQQPAVTWKHRQLSVRLKLAEPPEFITTNVLGSALRLRIIWKSSRTLVCFPKQTISDSESLVHISSLVHALLHYFL